MATKKTVTKIVKETIKETPNMIRVLDRITKERLVIDANKEKDYKTKYLHIGWGEFIG